jgi:regulator of protease activity HflC (stomatin/prohibitin superfamily)
MPEALILLIVLILLALFQIVRSFRMVPEHERLVILKMGRYTATRGPGLTMVLPLIEQAIRIDMREKSLDMPAQTATTQDNAPVAVEFSVSYQVVDPRLSIIAVDQVARALINLATTTLRAVIGELSRDDVLFKRHQISETLRMKLDEVAGSWGLKINRVEIRKIEPSRDVQDAMNRQKSA